MYIEEMKNRTRNSINYGIFEFIFIFIPKIEMSSSPLSYVGTYIVVQHIIALYPTYVGQHGIENLNIIM